MYLIHKTDLDFLSEIVRSNYLLPSSKTNNSGQGYDGSPLPYIFMNCIKNDPKYMDRLRPYTFVFPIDILYDRQFYTDIEWAAGNISEATYYKKNTPLPEIKDALDKLFTQSVANAYRKRNMDFTFKQEIFFKKRVDLHDATHLVITDRIPKELITYLKEHYPNMKLVMYIKNPKK
jgi:hypothetical protein